MPMIEPGGVRRSDALDLLAEASRLLARSFDLSATLPLVADLCVRKFADYCAIHARLEDGAITLVEACREPGFHAPVADATAIPDVLNEYGFEAVVAAPLNGRHGTLGTFVIASRSRDAFNGTAQKLANVLALQLAGAMDQAILFDRTYRVADRLQRALLPESFPRVPGTEFHAAYRPASDEAEIGGDWYDAFALPDGRIAVSMGDVAGHGLEAATVMGEIRQAMRTTAVGEHSPAAVLEHINSVINLRKSIGMVTAIFGYYQPQTRELTYAVAGHPPPVLTIIDGFSGLLPGGGMPLGVETQIQAKDWIIALPPRSCVVFYTDGMTEHSRDVIAGERQLIECSIRAFEMDPENPALALQERIFDATVNRDDAAALTLSCSDGSLPDEVCFSAVTLAAPIARSFLHRFCDSAGVSNSQRFSLITAAGEAIANAVEHAYRGDSPGDLFLRMHADDAALTVEVEDHGRWRPFQRRDERGRGIVLMHELMDHVRITSAQNKTVIRLVMNRSGEPAPH